LERSLASLLLLFALLVLVSSFTVAVPMFGLSTILGVSVLASSVLGSSVLGSSVLGSSVLGSSVLASTTIVEAYTGAVVASQLWLSLTCIGLLVFLELSNPVYEERTRAHPVTAKPKRNQRQPCFRARIRIFLELRKSWLPVSTLLVILFLIIVALNVWGILA
jgi:hypothetical protein